MASLDRRAVLAGAGAVLANSVAPLAAAPFNWQSVAPAEAGFAPDINDRLDKLIADKRAWNLHGVVVVRGRRIVLERYFAGEDQTWGISLGVVQYASDMPHDMRSVSKSIVALLYGIALADGKVPAVDTPLFTQFPEYEDLFKADERRRLMTVQHALTMTLGTDWDESGPYDSPANNEIGMEMAADRYRYILERAVIMPPASASTTTAAPPLCSRASS